MPGTPPHGRPETAAPVAGGKHSGECPSARRKPPPSAPPPPPPPPPRLDKQPQLCRDGDLRPASRSRLLSPTLPQRPAPRPHNGFMVEPEPEPEMEPGAQTQTQGAARDGVPEAEPEVATPAQPFHGEEGVAFVERDPADRPPQAGVNAVTPRSLEPTAAGARVPAHAPPTRTPARTPARKAPSRDDGSTSGQHTATKPHVAEASPAVTPRRRTPPQATSQHGHSQQQRAEAHRLASAADNAVKHAVVKRLERHRRARHNQPPAPSPRKSTTSRCPTSSSDSPGPRSAPAREGQPPAPAVPPSPVGIGRPARLPSLFLVDWDDTILPTSMLGKMIPLNDLARAGSRDATRAVATTAVRGRLSSEFTDQLRRLETAALRSLERIIRAVGLESLVLVTNAAQGWVDATASLLMPTLYSRMLRPESGKGVRVVYARPASVNRPSQCTKGAQTAWKLAAFALEVSSARAASIAAGTGPRLNLVSMGDSDYERTAMKRAATRRSAEGRARAASGSGAATESTSPVHGNNCGMPPDSAESPDPLDRFWFESDSGDVVKTVKFRESPEAFQLRKQWQRIWEMLPELCEDTSSYDTVLRP